MAKQKKSSSVVVDLCRDKRDANVYVIFYGPGKRVIKKNSYDPAVGIWRAAGLRRTLLDIDVVKALFPDVDISPGEGPVRLRVDVTFAYDKEAEPPATLPGNAPGKMPGSVPVVAGETGEVVLPLAEKDKSK